MTGPAAAQAARGAGPGAAAAVPPTAVDAMPASDLVDIRLLDATAGPVGLAVSGGSDSVALAVLVAELRPALRPLLLTVDHGLRAGAADDCEFVERLGRGLGLAVVRLTIAQRPRGSLQAWAREARYTALSEAARRHGLVAVATGHTLDDQAETLLMRLARGSGLRGLSAMRDRTMHHGLVVLRPLLGSRRADLRAALVARGHGWRDDPSNDDLRFDRAALRRQMPELAAIGLTPERLAAVAGHLARASDAVDGMVDALAATAMREDRAGAIVIEHAPWRSAPQEVRLRLLGAAAARAGGTAVPRFEALFPAEGALLDGAPATLGHVCAAVGNGRLMLWREARNIADLTLGPGENGVFDGRWAVHNVASGVAVTVSPLGPQVLRKIWTGAFAPAIVTAPGLYCAGTELVAAPTLGIRLRNWPADAVKFTRIGDMVRRPIPPQGSWQAKGLFLC